MIDREQAIEAALFPMGKWSAFHPRTRASTSLTRFLLWTSSRGLSWWIVSRDWRSRCES